MKYLITESKLGDIIYKYLDSQDFVITESDDSTFIHYPSDLFAQIKVDYEDSFCELNFEIVNNISSLFSIDRDWSLHYITEWVNDKLETRISELFAPIDYFRKDMLVPK
jgi:hypothetical protein